MSPSVHQKSYDLLCESLEQVLTSVMEAGSAVGSVEVRTMATLYELLGDHPVDRKGRCRSCRRPGAVMGLRRRRCRVHRTAHFYLHHPDDTFFVSHLATVVGVSVLAAPLRDAKENAVASDRNGDSEDTDVLPRLAADSEESPPDFQAPAVSPSALLPGGFPGARQPVPDHGGAGVLNSPGLAVARCGGSGQVTRSTPGEVLMSKGAA